MLARHIWQRIMQPVESSDLGELRRDTIWEIGAIVFVAAWGMLIAEYSHPENIVVPLFLCGGAR